MISASLCEDLTSRSYAAFISPASEESSLAFATVSDIESALAEAKAKLDSSDAGEINAAYDRLVKSSHKLAEIMYQQASQAGAQGGATEASGAAAGGSTSGSTGDDNVIDADFVDVDDKK